MDILNVYSSDSKHYVVKIPPSGIEAVYLLNHFKNKLSQSGAIKIKNIYIKYKFDDDDGDDQYQFITRHTVLGPSFIYDKQTESIQERKFICYLFIIEQHVKWNLTVHLSDKVFKICISPLNKISDIINEIKNQLSENGLAISLDRCKCYVTDGKVKLCLNDNRNIYEDLFCDDNIHLISDMNYSASNVSINYDKTTSMKASDQNKNFNLLNFIPFKWGLFMQYDSTISTSKKLH